MNRFCTVSAFDRPRPMRVRTSRSRPESMASLRRDSVRWGGRRGRRIRRSAVVSRRATASPSQRPLIHRRYPATRRSGRTQHRRIDGATVRRSAPAGRLQGRAVRPDSAQPPQEEPQSGRQLLVSMGLRHHDRFHVTRDRLETHSALSAYRRGHDCGVRLGR